MFPAFLLRSWLAVPATAVKALVAFPTSIPVKVEAPVPPLPTANCPDHPADTEAAFSNALDELPPNDKVTLVSLCAVSAAGVTVSPEKPCNPCGP